MAKNVFIIMVILILAAATWAQADITSGLVGYWKFDEGSGTSLTDSSGNGGTATLNYPSSNNWVTFINSALNFGTSPEMSYVLVPLNPVLDPTSALTISAWIDIATTTGSQYGGQNIVGKCYYGGSYDNGGYCLSLNNGKLNLTLYNSTGSAFVGSNIIGSQTLSLNTWYHVAATFDGNTTKLYINGLLDYSGSTGNLHAIKPASATAMSIGQRTVGEGHLSGYIDEVRVYNRALSADEISSLYSSEHANISTVPPLRIQPYPFVSVLSSGTTKTVLSVTTDSNSICRCDTTPGTAYNSMATTFTTTGSTTHYQLLTGLHSDQTYNYYIKCKDNIGNANTDDLTVSFSVASGSPTPATNPNGNNYYVSPGITSIPGDSNAGGLDYPFSLSYAAGANGMIQPGDIVWLRGGTYTGAVIFSLSGTTNAAVTFRNYNRERAIYDGQGGNGVFNIAGSYLTFWGLEFMDSMRDSVTVAPYSTIGALDNLGISYINDISHDNGIGLGSGTLAYGNILYYNGRNNNLEHSIYWHNNWYSVNGLIKGVADNISFASATYGIQIYGSGASAGTLQGFLFDGNTLIDDGFQEGGGSLVDHTTIQNTYMYSANLYLPNYDPNNPGWGTYGLRLGYAISDNTNVVVENNYFANAGVNAPIQFFKSFDAMTFTGNTLISKGVSVGLEGATPSDLFPVGPYTVDNNTYYYNYLHNQSQPFYYHLASWGNSSRTLAQWQTDTNGLGGGSGFDLNSTASTATPPDQVFIRPNLYESGRANIIIYNWSHASTKSVDVSSILIVGDTYELHSVQNYFGDVITGTYSGGSLTIPMTGRSVVAPINGDVTTPASTFPEFGAFVLIRTASGSILYGDVSGDGNVSAYDAALAAQYAVGLITLTSEQVTRADVSGGGNVSAYDAALIAQYAVGLISKFPVEGS